MRFGFLLSIINFLLQLSHNVAIFPGNIANQYYLNKQRFLLEILHHLHEPLLHKQWIALGQQIVSDKAEYVHYNEHMHRFYEYIRTGRLLPRNVYYNPHQPEHYQETQGLYHFFYNTREWSTLRQNICWARLHVNPALFLYALMQTLMKRDDYRALIVPKIYELLPAPYHRETVVREAINFNYINWIRQELRSENGSLPVQFVIPKKLFPTNIAGDMRNTDKWSEAMSEVQILSFKESKKTKGINYLTEDIGWLAYWYYINMGIALQEEQTQAEREQLRDWFYWQLSQLLARYKLELYGQQKEYKRLSSTPARNYDYLLNWQGRRYQPEIQVTMELVAHLLTKFEFNVAQAVSTQSYNLTNGTLLDLRKSLNWQLGLSALFPYDLSHLQISHADRPQLILDLHTMLRHPLFYSYADRLWRAYRTYRSEFQSSYHQPVRPTDMEIESVEVSPLITYDEPVDVDVSNIMHSRNFYFDTHFMWPHSLQVRKHRLQQRPFTISFQIASNKTQSIILRTYLTTSSGYITEEPYYQLDAFLTILYMGNNTITRDSTDFSSTIGDHISLTELYHYVSLAEQERFDFPLNITIPSCGFPRRLILPKGGTSKALSMRLLTLATPYNYKARQGNELYCDFSNGVSRWDELPLGYPFERFVEQDELLGAHTFWRTIKIKHENGK